MIRILILNLSTFLLLSFVSTNVFGAEEKTDGEKKTESTKEEKSDKKKEGDSLHDLMESIGDDFKTAYKGIKAKDATKKADILKAIANLKKNAEASKKLVPHKVEKIKDADEKKKQTEDYKKQIGVLIENIDKLKKKVDADDWDGAMTLVKSMSSHKKKSHEKFEEEDEDH